MIRLAVNGDRQAFGRLVEAHYDFIHAVAWRWTGRSDEADDIAQEVCIKLAQAIRGFRGESRFRSWLYTLTLNAVRDQARKARRETIKAEAYFSDPAFHVAGEDEAETAALWEAVRQLPARQRDCVLLVYGEEMNHAEAADVLGCSEATVSWHVHEARKRLRDMLGRDVA